MTRTTQVLIVGAGVTGFVLGLNRLLRGKPVRTLPYGHGIKVKRAVGVSASADRLYAFWRKLENLPVLFDNVSLIELDDTHSHWTFRAPGGISLEWDAEITVDRKNEMIGWRSLAGASLDNAGYVRFDRTPGGRGTIVRVALQYSPPAGKAGAALSALLGKKPAEQVERALRKLKQLVEAGVIARTAPAKLRRSLEPVEAASRDSFPASDAPAWTGTTGVAS
jgi:uncharacterized membrane protein